MKDFREYISESRIIKGDPLIDDLEAIKKHINDFILKNYKVKIQTLSLTRSYDQDVQIFESNPIDGQMLGVFGPVINHASIQLIVSDIAGRSNSKQVQFRIKYSTKNELNNSFPVGKYILGNGVIQYNSSQENRPIEEVGESKFALAMQEEI